jgi:hypothetical protein
MPESGMLLAALKPDGSNPNTWPTTEATLASLSFAEYVSQLRDLVPTLGLLPRAHDTGHEGPDTSKTTSTDMLLDVPSASEASGLYCANDLQKYARALAEHAS